MNVPSTKELFIEQKKKVTKCFNEKHKNVIPIIKLSEYKREKNKEYNEQTLDYTIYGLEVRKRNREITPVIQSIQKDNKALIDNNLINKVIIVITAKTSSICINITNKLFSILSPH